MRESTNILNTNGGESHTMVGETARTRDPLEIANHGVANHGPIGCPSSAGPSMPMPEPTVFSPEQAAHYLGLYDLGVPNPVGTVKRYVKRKKLEHFKISGRIAFQRSHLDKFIETLNRDARKGGSR